MNQKAAIKVAVGMSGGVDSTVTAYLLKQEGYDVFGVTMYLFDYEDEEGRLIQPPFIKEAERVCHLLGMSHHVVDLREVFDEKIVKPFAEAYLSGLTPNPCVLCNQKIKYGLFMDAALALGADKFATGHYATIDFNKESQLFELRQGVAERKDQAYFLHQLDQERLSKVILPLGCFENKQSIRAIASTLDLDISKKGDSQGICFVPEGAYSKIVERILEKPVGRGNVIDISGKVIGSHQGYYKYTIGQKKGLIIDHDLKGAIIRISPENNEIVYDDENFCYTHELVADGVNWLVPYELWPKADISVRICQWGYDLKASIMPILSTSMKVIFEEPVRAVAPGQYCVVYYHNQILAGGLIRDFSEK